MECTHDHATSQLLPSKSSARAEFSNQYFMLGGSVRWANPTFLHACPQLFTTVTLSGLSKLSSRSKFSGIHSDDITNLDLVGWVNVLSKQLHFRQTVAMLFRPGCFPGLRHWRFGLTILQVPRLESYRYLEHQSLAATRALASG